MGIRPKIYNNNNNNKKEYRVQIRKPFTYINRAGEKSVVLQIEFPLISINLLKLDTLIDIHEYIDETGEISSKSL